jgi:glucose-1-phosphate cytidylyltransferase
MKAIILAGGLGTRLSEETLARPKPMVEIGEKPLLWHIMKIYSSHGINDFIICCGYKGYVIKEYFANYFLHTSDVTFDLHENRVEVHQKRAEPWRVSLIDTGERTMTGGRLRRVAEYIGNDEVFCFTYGDGLSDVDITASIEFHRRHGKLATVTAAYATGRFGALEIQGKQIKKFLEKPRGDGALVNGGFFVLTKKVFEYLEDDLTVWEDYPLNQLALDEQLMAFKHENFWQPMDTLRDKVFLEELWSSGKAPWKIWE